MQNLNTLSSIAHITGTGETLASVTDGVSKIKPSGKLNKLYFSQQSLNTYNTCPMKFRLRYIDGLYWPRTWTTEEEKNRLEKGSQFHLLAQRYYSDIDSTVPQGSKYDGDLQQWLGQLQNDFPPIKENYYYPEFTLRLNRNGIKLQAKYDLIVHSPDNRLTIYDWKTDTKPLQKTRLLTGMQTMVYLYLLTETGLDLLTGETLTPETIKMIYWNPLFPTKSIEINYSASKHIKFAKQLTGLITVILNSNYEEFLPNQEETHCSRCEYSPVCHGVKGVAEAEVADADADAISGSFVSFEHF